MIGSVSDDKHERRRNQGGLHETANNVVNVRPPSYSDIVGGGVGVCSTAKTVVALPNAWFLFSEVRLGIIPAIVSPFVCNRIGKAQCKWNC